MRANKRRVNLAPAPHLCHARGCQTAVPEKLLMCSRHWGQVPKVLQRAVWAAYVPGQEISKTPSRAYLEAAQAAIDAVADKDRRSSVSTVDAGQQGTLL